MLGRQTKQLSHHKNPLFLQIHEIKSQIDIDLSNRIYKNFNTYIEGISKITNTTKYNPNIPLHQEFFNYSDKLILWCEGILFFSKKLYTKALSSFVNALCITCDNFSLNKMEPIPLIGLDINIYNSIISTKLEHEDFFEIEKYITHLKKVILNAPTHYHDIYIRLSFNTSTLYFHQKRYTDAISLIDETLEYMQNTIFL